MGKTTPFYVLILISFVSCTAEKVNLSPIANSLGNGSNRIVRSSNYTEKVNQINYSSEITNLISSIPKFSSEAVNAETEKLKYHLKDYIGGLEAYNFKGMESAYKNYEKSYKKLQKLKAQLNPDEVDVLNRYLVLIKTNMNTIDSKIQERDPTTT